MQISRSVMIPASLPSSMTGRIPQSALHSSSAATARLVSSPQHFTSFVIMSRTFINSLSGISPSEVAMQPGRRSNDRHVELATRHVQKRRGVVHYLVERQQTEIAGHDLHNGTHSSQRRTDASTHESGLRQW